MRHTLLLFDIDGTLVHGRGVGSHAMEQAGRELFGDRFTFAGVEFGGRLDKAMFHEAARRAGMDAEDHHHEDFKSRYVQALGRTLAEPSHPVTPTPGAHDLVAQLRRRVDEVGDVVLGMLTGNYGPSAALKLAAAGIDIGWFEITAFGDEADTRPGLTELCLQRYAQRHRADADPSRVIVLGDTPRDVDCAKAHGCIAFAVATGKFSAEDLHNAGADIVVHDLTDPTPLLDLIKA